VRSCDENLVGAAMPSALRSCNRWFNFAFALAGIVPTSACDPCPECTAKKPSPTPTPTKSFTPTPTATLSATPTVTPSIAPTATPSIGPTATPTPPPPVGSCVPAGSMSILVQGSNVTTYIPNGNWGETTTGVQMVPVEGTGISAASISTPNVVNSCSSNSITGQTVCVSNGTDVYVISGSSILNTLTDSASGTVTFSGGSCSTCGVLVDESSNTAFIGISTSQSSSGFQLLNLTNNSFASPLSAQNANISESFAIYPTGSLLLSPSEAQDNFNANFQLLQLNAGAPSPFDFQSAATAFASPNNFLDGGASDCSTGVALSSVEFTNNLFVTDLSQATFAVGTGGLPGTWNAPNQRQSFPDFDSFTAGTTGLALTPSGHLGILEDEGGASAFGAVHLPSTAGSATPAVVDWVAASMPATDPSGQEWFFPLDPHALTAYVSPNNGKSYGLMVSDARTFVVKVDLAALLAAPRSSGTHTVDPSVNLVTTGVITFILTGEPTGG
jgi:hypothetical protein